MHGSYDICSIMHPHWSSSVRRDGETNMYMTTISFLRMLFFQYHFILLIINKGTPSKKCGKFKLVYWGWVIFRTFKKK